MTFHSFDTNAGRTIKLSNEALDMLRHFVRALKPMALGLKVITMVSSGDEGAAPVASLGISDLDAGGEISMLDWFEFDETCIYFPVDDALLGLSLEIEIGTSRGRLTVVS